MPKIPRPPRPDYFSITRESVIKATQESRKALFDKQREKLYEAIYDAANSARYHLDFYFDERVSRSDLEELKKELEDKGFKIKLNGGIREQCEISWYE